MAILELLAGIGDLISSVCAIVKHWRITVCVLASILLIFGLCALTESPPIRWIVGFQLGLALVTLGVIWNSRKVNRN